MGETLCSVGLDVGTTTTQMVVSRLEMENRATGFGVPEMEITRRQVVYESPVYFTPLLDSSHVDPDKIREILAAEYQAAGICREDVDTGAVIITGETSRKENARRVLSALSAYAGDFVVATAGPEQESILAAKGAGAVDYSEKTGKTVLHMDIGGGTSNLAWIQRGEILETGCLNIGGRLLKFDDSGTVTYVSPVLDGLCKLKAGDIGTVSQVEDVAMMLTEALEMAAGLREPTQLLTRLTTEELGRPLEIPLSARNQPAVLSFSGGVADCIETSRDWLTFGDMGAVLGKAIRNSRLCAGEYRLGEQTIRATVIGAGCHSAQLSGSTVFVRNIPFPLKNKPVAVITESQQKNLSQLPRVIGEKLKQLDAEGFLALPGELSPSYQQLKELAEALAEGFGDKPILIAVEQDMAKALGQALCLKLPRETPILCIDRVKLSQDSYLDVASPRGPALPVVVKTLILKA